MTGPEDGNCFAIGRGTRCKERNEVILGDMKSGAQGAIQFQKRLALEVGGSF